MMAPDIAAAAEGAAKEAIGVYPLAATAWTLV